MEQVVTVKQIQEIDAYAIKQLGIPSIALMENAGKEVAIQVLRLAQKTKIKKVVVICAAGNNAGDGLVAARHLMSHPLHVSVLMIADSSRLKSDALVNYKVLKNLRFKIREAKKVTPSVKELLKEAIVVDAIFGVGLSRSIEEPIRSFIECVNQYARKIISVDVPSGIDATTGEILGCAVKADITVTFSLAKKGCFIGDGKRYAGRIKVADIGIPLRKIKI